MIFTPHPKYTMYFHGIIAHKQTIQWLELWLYVFLLITTTLCKNQKKVKKEQIQRVWHNKITQ